jgi:hypothetical protein
MHCRKGEGNEEERGEVGEKKEGIGSRDVDVSPLYLTVQESVTT